MTAAERQRQWRKDNPDYAKNRYAANRRRGVCHQCGKPSPELTVCRECLAKRKEK